MTDQSTTFIGLAFADSMVPPTCIVTRVPMTVEEVLVAVEAGVTSACNASHANSLAALDSKHGIKITAEGAPKVDLMPGDSIIVMSVRGLPRLEGTSQYTDDQITKATFAFGKWTVK